MSKRLQVTQSHMTGATEFNPRKETIVQKWLSSVRGNEGALLNIFASERGSKKESLLGAYG